MTRNWPILFIVIPLVELYLIIKIGGYIGALWTVIIVVMTAVIGVQLLRIQGFNTLTRAQQSMARGSMPALEMMEGIVLAVGGALLITPGFLTETLGFLCLIPFTRRAMIRAFIARSTIVGMGGFHHHGGGSNKPGNRPGGSDGGKTIEGEYHRHDRDR